MTPPSVQRHLSRSGLAQYLAANVPATVAAPGDPICHITIDPMARTMSLRTPRRSPTVPDLAEFEHVEARMVAADGVVWSEMVVDYVGHGHEAYLLLTDVADLIQQNGAAFDDAVRLALATFEDLLAHASGLSPQQQTGLYGELLFLRSSLDSMGANSVVAAWKGFAPNEHDFVLPGCCFEIKTTRTERRQHRVSGLHQLQPLPGSRLWVVSVQITSATEANGRTLAELVDDVRSAVGPARRALDESLQRAGWRDRDRAQYREPLTLRSIPTAYDVADDFPVLDREIVDRGCPRSDLIVDVEYTVDLTSLPPGMPPAPADQFVKEDG